MVRHRGGGSGSYSLFTASASTPRPCSWFGVGNGVFWIKGHKRKPNLALGHLISYVIETKYQLQYPAPLNLPTLFYSNSSFNTLHSTHLHPEDEEPRGAEEEEAHAPAPVPDPTPLCQHSQLDQLVGRFDRWETRFNAYVAAQEQQHSKDMARYEQHRTEDLARFDSYITHQQQQHDQDITWFNAQFTTLASYFQQPPPPPPYDDQDPLNQRSDEQTKPVQDSVGEEKEVGVEKAERGGKSEVAMGDQPPAGKTPGTKQRQREKHCRAAYVAAEKQVLLPEKAFSMGETLKTTCSIFGKTLKIDNATSSGSRPSVARILVELDVTKKYLDKIWIGPDTIEYVQSVSLEDFSMYYTHYYSLGYLKAECRSLHSNFDSPIVPPLTIKVNNMLGVGGEVVRVLPGPAEVPYDLMVVAPVGIVCDDSRVHDLVVELDIVVSIEANELELKVDSNIALVLISPLMDNEIGTSDPKVGEAIEPHNCLTNRVGCSSDSPAPLGDINEGVIPLSYSGDDSFAINGSRGDCFLEGLISSNAVCIGKESDGVRGHLVGVPLIVISSTSLLAHLAGGSNLDQCDWLDLKEVGFLLKPPRTSHIRVIKGRDDEDFGSVSHGAPDFPSPSRPLARSSTAPDYFLLPYPTIAPTGSVQPQQPYSTSKPHPTCIEPAEIHSLSNPYGRKAPKTPIASSNL
ncbi:hypothetical protein MA16_Dca020843 [Dendrobium catenatum]|uniref:Uncharacterized protein n=1 Tax=Dendrobium catenatum TaxID=906689 RepID=A0A2I0V8A5_9ASPA|nr:hypothetical protein MA16_Dca020843 [Dendrobium catenatum]